MIKMTISSSPSPVKTTLTSAPSTVKMETSVPIMQGPMFATYTYDQMVASKSWEIEHNLNCYPSVSIIDTGGNLVMGEVKYISNNKLIVSFSSIFSGKAYLN